MRFDGRPESGNAGSAQSSYGGRGHHIDRHAVYRYADISAVVDVEAAQENLFHFARRRRAGR